MHHHNDRLLQELQGKLGIAASPFSVLSRVVQNTLPVQHLTASQHVPPPCHCRCRRSTGLRDIDRNKDAILWPGPWPAAPHAEQLNCMTIAQIVSHV